MFKEEFQQDKNIYSGFNGDYTHLLVGPIKAMERFLKEVLVKKYSRSVVVCDPKEKKMIPNLKLNVKLSAEDVSGAKGNLINPKIKTVLELGPVARLLADNLQNDSSYKGKLFKLNPQNRFIFNDVFIQNIRNGHFHIHMVSTYDEAIDLYKQVSYFFRKCIDELDCELD